MGTKILETILKVENKYLNHDKFEEYLKLDIEPGSAEMRKA